MTDARDSSPPSASTELDLEAAQRMALTVWEFRQGQVVSLMIHLGDRLGLYRALEGGGEMTAAELASATGLQERWLHEWLRSQAAAGLLRCDDEGEHFELEPEGAAVLADEESLFFAAGSFSSPPDPDVLADIAEAFRTGMGLPYDRLGVGEVHVCERMFGPWTRATLVSQILPALDGVVAKLESGVRVADIGCGAAVTLTEMARAYPRSEFHGHDPSTLAIDRARQRVAELGLDNVHFTETPAQRIPPEPRYDLVLAFDCIHDMTHPAEALAAVRASLTDDGTLLIKDIRSEPRFADNLKNPLLAMMYGGSVLSCMSSALSEPGGAGLGTLGFNHEVARRMCREAGFSRFREHDFGDPANLFYEVRP